MNRRAQQEPQSVIAAYSSPLRILDSCVFLTTALASHVSLASPSTATSKRLPSWVLKLPGCPITQEGPIQSKPDIKSREGWARERSAASVTHPLPLVNRNFGHSLSEHRRFPCPSATPRARWRPARDRDGPGRYATGDLPQTAFDRPHANDPMQTTPCKRRSAALHAQRARFARVVKERGSFSRQVAAYHGIAGPRVGQRPTGRFRTYRHRSHAGAAHVEMAT